MSYSAGGLHGYPGVWVRWVHRQVRAAVAYELAAADPRHGPHLRRLPLTVQGEQRDREAFLRNLIVGLAGRSAQVEPAARSDAVAAALLDTPGIQIAEPDLQVMLAWHLAAHHTPIPVGGDDAWPGQLDPDHECFDPEVLATEMVASGLIAPSWKLREISARYNELAARNPTAAITPPRRTRTPKAAAYQLALPFTA